MVSRIEVIPLEVRGYGNIVAPKTIDDFIPVDSELAYEDGVYTLGYDSGSISVSLTVSSSSITVGSSVILSATVLEEEVAVSGGTVTFKDGSAILGTADTNSSGVATYTASSLAIGTHSLTAVYDGKSSLAVTVTVEDVPVPVPDSITLTEANSKTILSYADSDTASLVATVLDSNDDPCEGVTVTFKKNGTSIGTADTNSSGVASKSYASAGSGDVSFTAEVGIILSETYGLEDCLDFDPLTSDNSKFTKTGSATITYNSNGLSMVGSANSTSLYKYNGTVPTDFILEYDVVSYTLGSYDFSSEILVSHTAISNGKVSGSNKTRFGTFPDANYGNTGFTYTDVTLISAPYHLKIVVDSGTATFYVDNVQVHQRTAGTADVGFKSYNNRGVLVKNMKIKPL